MRRITAAIIAIVLMVVLNRLFDTAPPLARIVFAEVACCAAWTFLLWKDLAESALEHPEA